MGVELELYVLIAILILGPSIFAVFEVSISVLNRRSRVYAKRIALNEGRMIV